VITFGGSKREYKVKLGAAAKTDEEAPESKKRAAEDVADDAASKKVCFLIAVWFVLSISFHILLIRPN
jgi:hypothetical protein